jgi:hypothetical protein
MYFVIVFYLNVAYVSHICCNSMFQMFLLFLSYVVASGSMLQVAILDVFYVSHTCCKCMFQMFFMLQVLYVVRPGTSRGRADAGTRGRQMVVLLSVCAGGVLVFSSSSWLLSAARTEREEWVRGDRRVQRLRRSACVGWGEDGWGWCKVQKG